MKCFGHTTWVAFLGAPRNTLRSPTQIRLPPQTTGGDPRVPLRHRGAYAARRGEDGLPLNRRSYQGSAASPTLFIIYLQAILDTFTGWKDNAPTVQWYDGQGKGHGGAASTGRKKQKGKEKLKTFLNQMQAIRTAASKAGRESTTIALTAYADDVASIQCSRDNLANDVTAFDQYCCKWGLTLHTAKDSEGKSKTEFMVIPPRPAHGNWKPHYDRSPIQIGSRWITHASTRVGGATHAGSFKYLGSIVQESLEEHLEIAYRINAAARVFGRFHKRIFANRRVRTKTKAVAFKAFVLPPLSTDATAP